MISAMQIIKTIIATTQRIINPLNGISTGVKISQISRTKAPQRLIVVAPIKPSPRMFLEYPNLSINNAIPIPNNTHPRIVE